MNAKKVGDYVGKLTLGDTLVLIEQCILNTMNYLQV